MLKLGVREFRERLSQVANGTEFIVITNNGREVGTYMPNNWARDVGAARLAAAAVAQAQQELRERGIDLDAAMARLGMSPNGEPLNEE